MTQGVVSTFLIMNTGEMELDGDLEDSEKETWPTDERISSENESGQFIHGEDGEEMSNNGDQVDDVTTEVESDEDTDDE